MNGTGKIVTASLAATLLGGCATVPREAGFGSVQKSVAERGGPAVQWRGHTAEDAAVDAAVRSLLAKPELTADDAVQIALLNNLSLQATYQDLGVAQADLVQAGLLKNPSLYLERRWPGQAAEVDVAQDFLDILVRPLRKRIAASEFEAAKLRVADAVVKQTVEVRSAYFTLQGAEQMLEMRRSVVAATDASADAARRLREAGNIQELEFRGEQKLAAQAKLDLAAAESEVVQDRERLNVLMGLWGGDTTWKIGRHLPDPAPTEVPQPGLESLAIGQRLDLAVARQQVEATARALGLTEVTRYVPVLTIGAHYEHEVEPVWSAGPSVQLELPIFDQGQAAIARGSARLAQSRQRYAALAIEIRSEVRAAYSRMAVARARAEYYRREVLPLSQSVLDQTQLLYNGMFVGVFQLLQAKQAQIEAGRAYIDALRDYWVARAELERAVGTRRLTADVQPATRPTTAAAAERRPQQPAPAEHQH